MLNSSKINVQMAGYLWRKRKNPFMKASIVNLAAARQTRVFPKAFHRRRPNPKKATPNPKSQKRNNVSLKSRDTREDRGWRQMKTKYNSQTLFRICGEFSP
jgi:hypothetical protein